MKRFAIVLAILALLGILFSCATTNEEVLSLPAPVEETEEAVTAEPAAEPEVTEEVAAVEVTSEAEVEEQVLSEEPAVQTEDMAPARQVWSITSATVTENDRIIATSTTIPSEFQEMSYLVTATDNGVVSFDVSGHNVATGIYRLLETGEIQVLLAFIDWEALELVENYYDVYAGRGLMPLYYFFAEEFTGDSVVLKAHAYGMVLTLEASRL